MQANGVTSICQGQGNDLTKANSAPGDDGKRFRGGTHFLNRLERKNQKFAGRSARRRMKYGYQWVP